MVSWRCRRRQLVSCDLKVGASSTSVASTRPNLTNACSSNTNTHPRTSTRLIASNHLHRLLGSTIVAWTIIHAAVFARNAIAAEFSNGGTFVLRIRRVRCRAANNSGQWTLLKLPMMATIYNILLWLEWKGVHKSYLEFWHLHWI